MARQTGPKGRQQTGQKAQSGTGSPGAGQKTRPHGQRRPVFKEITWLQRWPRLVATCFTLLVLVEIVIFLWVAEHIGLALTLLALLGSAVIGLWLIRRTGLDMVGKLRLTLAQGQEPGHSLVDGACFVIAGLLLIMPGFFSDVMAICLMLPVTRNWLIRRFASKIVGGMAAGRATSGKIITDVDFREVRDPAGAMTAADDPLDQPFHPATPSEAASEPTPAALSPEAADTDATPVREDVASAASGEIIAPPPKPAPSADEEDAGETDPTADEERWGSRAPRRPIIDVEEN